MINDLRVGIPMIGSHSWLGGVSHMELHIKAVTSISKTERPQLFLLITEESIARLDLYQPFIRLFDGVIYIGMQRVLPEIDLPVVYCANEEELFKHIDFYFPVNFNVLPGRCAASWVHDFQHKHLPQLFSQQDIAIRDELCTKIASYSQLIFCSSKAVESDFRTFYPWSKAITRVLSLRVYPEEEWYKGDPVKVQEKYKLPASFVLCSNQFWLHKNHKLLFTAIHLLRQKGIELHLVCTGQTGDFRSPAYFKELQDYLAHLGIQDSTYFRAYPAK
jgi:glycosyltransferase involved in cell wall biosynthesis